MQSLQELPAAAGYAANLRPFKRDEYAMELVERHFPVSVKPAFDHFHRSSLNYDVLVDSLMDFDIPIHSAEFTRTDQYQLALQSVMDDFKALGKVNPISFEEVQKHTDFPRNKSAGLPWINRGLRKKGETLEFPGVMEYIKNKWRRIGKGYPTSLEDCTLVARAQVCTIEKEKIRPAWGYPLEVYSEEARFFLPFMDRFKEFGHNIPIAYGFEMMNGGMRAIHSAFSRVKKLYVSTDWSQFDVRCFPQLIRDAFSVIDQCFNFDVIKHFDEQIEVSEEKMKRRWKRVIKYFINTPIRTPKGKRFRKKSSVPSGSTFTNLVDSIINMIVVRTCVREVSGSFPSVEIYMGDDSCFGITGFMDMTKFAECAKECFGFKLNVEKSFFTNRLDNLKFLGYWNEGGLPRRAVDPLIVGFVEPEYERRDAIELASAALGMMWACCDPTWAVCWRSIINEVCQTFGHSGSDVVTHFRETFHRHRYLIHVGDEFMFFNIPDVVDDMIFEVIPQFVCKRRLKVPRWNYFIIWNNVLTRRLVTFVSDIDLEDEDDINPVEVPEIEKVTS